QPRPLFFFSSRRRHTRFDCDWSSDVCSSDLLCSYTVDVGDAVHLLDGVRTEVAGAAGGARLLAEVDPAGQLADNEQVGALDALRSEERRVGKEWRGVAAAYHSVKVMSTGGVS